MSATTPQDPRPSVERRAFLGQRAARVTRALLAWTPVWIPLVFLGQLLVLGWWPAAAEAARLERAAAEVRARAAALEAEERELAARSQMLADPIYRERVRRSLVDPAARPLTLERARSAEHP
jgi:hypothetical protein